MHVNNKNFMIAIVGDTGNGKSWAALRMAELLDRDFDASKVTFTPEGLLERINEEQPPGDITVVDEAGVSMNAKTWWESDQIQLGNILETWRHQNRGLIFTLPVFNKLQKDARGLVHGIMTAYGIDYADGTSTFRFQLVNQNNVTGEVYKPYPRLPHPETGAVTKFKKLKLSKPSEALRAEYQPRKEEFTQSLNEEALEDVRDAKEDAEEQKSPQEIADELANGDIGSVISEHGNTGEPYVNKELIRADFGLSHSEAETVKALLEREIDLSEVEL